MKILGVNFRSYDFFGFVGNPTSLVKPHGEKKKFRLLVHSNGISTTRKLEMDFFFSQLRKNLRNATSLERPFHVACDMSSEREFLCTVVCMSQFHCGNEVKQGHKVQTNKL